MDQRTTIDVNEDFEALVLQAQRENVMASFIVDDNGLERAEGHISEIKGAEGHKIVVLDNGQEFPVSSIMGLNGMFCSDFTCC